jgi:hypothetical protein
MYSTFTVQPYYARGRRADHGREEARPLLPTAPAPRPREREPDSRRRCGQTSTNPQDMHLGRPLIGIIREQMPETMNLIAGTSSTGSAAFEEVLVERCGAHRYRLVRSPGLVLGLAAGDIFERRPDGSFDVVEHGGNLCIQIFAGTGLEMIEADATARLAPLGGRLDGRSSEELVYTVSVGAGFGPVEDALRAALERFPDAEWYFGNVYDPADGVTPLNWWRK